MFTRAKFLDHTQPLQPAAACAIRVPKVSASRRGFLGGLISGAGALILAKRAEPVVPGEYGSPITEFTAPRMPQYMASGTVNVMAPVDGPITITFPDGRTENFVSPHWRQFYKEEI